MESGRGLGPPGREIHPGPLTRLLPLIHWLEDGGLAARAALNRLHTPDDGDLARIVIGELAGLVGEGDRL